MSVKFYKNEDGRIDPEDTILDDLSEMIRDETDEQLDDDQVAELATKMLNDMVEDGSLVQVDPKSEKPINEELVINGMSTQDIEDWKNKDPDSKIMKELQDELDDMKSHMSKVCMKFSKKADKNGLIANENYPKYPIDIEELDMFIDGLELEDGDTFDGPYLNNDGIDRGCNKVETFLIDAVNYDNPSDFVKDFSWYILGERSTNRFEYFIANKIIIDHSHLKAK